MIHGYHVIWGAYGFRLPNDPRGSWSDLVMSWELARFGKATKAAGGPIADDAWSAWQTAAHAALKYRPVFFTSRQAELVAAAFGDAAGDSRYTIWACSIMPSHVHLVLVRHHYKIEQVVNLLKGKATARLNRESLHPHAAHVRPDGRLPSMWGEGQWKVYLDSEQAIVNAIEYVEQNPVKEQQPRQAWSFVTPFAGVETGGWTTYH